MSQLRPRSVRNCFSSATSHSCGNQRTDILAELKATVFHAASPSYYCSPIRGANISRGGLQRTKSQCRKAKPASVSGQDIPSSDRNTGQPSTFLDQTTCSLGIATCTNSILQRCSFSLGTRFSCRLDQVYLTLN